MGLYVQVPSKTGGLPEKKVVLLEEHDPVWLELRHEHIKVVSPLPTHMFLNFLVMHQSSLYVF
jgi:syntaxin-binding protein 1